MKTVFNLEIIKQGRILPSDNTIQIIGARPACRPYVCLRIGEETAWIADKDLERLAINILKALNSKHIKQ